MKKKQSLYIASLTGVLALCAACSDDDSWGDAQLQQISTRLTFSLPQRIVGTMPAADSTAEAQTRMTDYVVQTSEDASDFRGLDDIRLLCFDAAPKAGARSRSGLSLTGGREISDYTSPIADFSKVYQVEVPLGTTHMAFYAKAKDDGSDPAHNGSLSADGLDGTTVALDDVTFAPVAICTSEADQGGSAAGQALVRLLNDLAATTGPEAAPDDRWSTAADEFLVETWRGLTELKTLSSANVERVLGTIHHLVSTIPNEFPGQQLGQAIAARIAAACATTPAAGDEVIVLSDQYQGFPADLGLPEGAARIEWDAASRRFVTPKAQVYGKGLDIPAMSDYVYPASLQYLALSPIVASDSLALPGDPLADDANTVYTSWQQLLDDCYADGYDRVKESTQSVAMVDQVQYAVGRLDSRVIMESRFLYDAYGRSIDAMKGFTLTGCLIAGQRPVGYDFQPIATSTDDYVIYDTDLQGGPQQVSYTDWTKYNHTLGLPTSADANVLMALQLRNDGPEFQGADGRIATGATFYLVADLVPRTAANYQSNTLDRVFISDHITTVSLSIMKGSADVNGDGKPDTDRNNDGKPDVYVFDPVTGQPTGIDADGDGTPEPTYDVNGDGTPDTFIASDTDSDGKPDTFGWDTDGDGTIDKPVQPADDDSWPDTPTTASGLATATYGIPTLVEQRQQRTFGLSVDLNWSRGHIFDIEF
ncbi:MAG: VCBS repeat-containing protein [Prevotella sp.]|nr:VCBS repeat-containing protein [Prevotella sp.]